MYLELITLIYSFIEEGNVERTTDTMTDYQNSKAKLLYGFEMLRDKLNKRIEMASIHGYIRHNEYIIGFERHPMSHNDEDERCKHDEYLNPLRAKFFIDKIIVSFIYNKLTCEFVNELQYYDYLFKENENTEYHNAKLQDRKGFQYFKKLDVCFLIHKAYYMQYDINGKQYLSIKHLPESRIEIIKYAFNRFDGVEEINIFKMKGKIISSEPELIFKRINNGVSYFSKHNIVLVIEHLHTKYLQKTFFEGILLQNWTFKQTIGNTEYKCRMKNSKIIFCTEKNVTVHNTNETSYNIIDNSDIFSVLSIKKDLTGFLEIKNSEKNIPDFVKIATNFYSTFITFTKNVVWNNYCHSRQFALKNL